MPQRGIGRGLMTGPISRNLAAGGKQDAHGIRNAQLTPRMAWAFYARQAGGQANPMGS
jgi:hypothetical protein